MAINSGGATTGATGAATTGAGAATGGACTTSGDADCASRGTRSATPTIAPFDTLEQTLASRVFTRNGACPPVGGNRVSFLTSGEESFERLEYGIRHAKHSIHIMTFILGRDAVGKRLVKLLAQRAREGVKVRLLLDGLGCFLSAGRFCDPIREAGGEVVKFMPVMPLQTPHSANLRNHRKIAVIDRCIAYTGSMNIADPRFFKQDAGVGEWVDAMVRVEGPAAWALEACRQR